METKLNSVNTQKLILSILETFSSAEILWLNRETKRANDLSQEQKEYLFLCLSFAIAKKEDPAYCGSIDSIGKSIIARQKSVDIKNVKMQDYREGFGWKNNVQLSRIKKGSAIMPPEKVMTLCAPFKKESDRRFWENQLYAYFPDTFVAPQDDADECGCQILRSILSRMGKEFQERIFEKLDQPEQEMLALVRQDKTVCKCSKLGEPPYRLYPVIDHLRASKNRMTVEYLVEDELQTTCGSWYGWKAEWEEAEKQNFSCLPKPRMSRRYFLAMAIVFELDYLETVMFLQLGGYRLGGNEKDRKLVRYFLKDFGDMEEVSADKLKADVLREL